MALRAGYQGFKKLLPGLKLFRPGYLGIDNAELSKTFFPRSEQSMYGAYNALPGPTGTKTAQGVTYTEGDNDVIALSGTSTAYSAYAYSTRTEKTFRLPEGKWKLIPRKTGTDDSTMSIGSGNAGDGSTGTYESWAYSTGNVVIFTVDSTRAGRYISCAIQIDGSKTANSTWQPMIVPADTPDNFLYVPHAMTNSQLTDAVEDVKDIKYTSDGTTYTRLKQYVVKPTITFASGVGTATLYKPDGETIGSFAIACANSDKAVAYVNVSGSTATVTLTDTSYSSTAPVTITYFTYKS